MSSTQRETSYAFESGYFPVPENPDTSLWRYMNFTKFVSLLDQRALYFSRTDLLGDPWEGSLTRTEAERRAHVDARLGAPKLHALTQAKVISEVTNSIVNCWHMNDCESMAMWRLYLTSPEGIAIRSTYRRLTLSFPQFDGVYKGRNADNTEKELLIHVGMVNYVDYESPTLPSHKIFRKRRSFEHEREVRAVATDTTWGNSPTFDRQGRPLTRFDNGGDHVPTDLEMPIEAVYVSPEAPRWFSDLVASTTRRFGVNCPVHHSDLARDPVF